MENRIILNLEIYLIVLTIGIWGISDKINRGELISVSNNMFWSKMLVIYTIVN